MLQQKHPINKGRNFYLIKAIYPAFLSKETSKAANRSELKVNKNQYSIKIYISKHKRTIKATVTRKSALNLSAVRILDPQRLS